MNNFEKYNKLHDEVMKRLKDGEITIETAKGIVDISFNKYIVEKTNSSSYAIKPKTLQLYNTILRELYKIHMPKSDKIKDDLYKLISDVKDRISEIKKISNKNVDVDEFYKVDKVLLSRIRSIVNKCDRSLKWKGNGTVDDEVYITRILYEIEEWNKLF